MNVKLAPVVPATRSLGPSTRGHPAPAASARAPGPRQPKLHTDRFTVDHGGMQISLPIREGRHIIPTQYASAEIDVAEGTHLDISLEVGPDAAGAVKVQVAAIESSPPLVVRNPSAAFAPHGGPVGAAWDRLTDLLVSAELERIHVSEAGDLVRDGSLTLPLLGAVARLDASEADAEHNGLPRINRDVETIASNAVVRPGRQRNVEPHQVTREELLEALGTLLEAPGTFELSVDSKEADATLDAGWLGRSSGRGPTRVRAKGTLSVDQTGALAIALHPGPEPTVQTPVGSLQLFGDLRGQWSASRGPQATAKLRYQARLAATRGGAVGLAAAMAALLGAAICASGSVSLAADRDALEVEPEQQPKVELKPQS